jgi:hypothetical protein
MSCNEMKQNFQSRKHIDFKDQWKTAATVLHKKELKYHRETYFQILQQLRLSLTEWLTVARPLRPAKRDCQFYNLFQRQSDIGWDQFKQGRLREEGLYTLHM